MSFAAKLQDVVSPANGPQCTMCALLNDLDVADPDEADAIRAAMGTRSVKFSDIARALQADGRNFNDQTVSRHARGGCAARVVLRAV